MTDLMKEINIEELLNEYTLDYSLFTDMDDRLMELYPKWIKLKKSDKVIMILYAEFQSYREVAKLLRISHTTAARFIKQIRERLC